jgi:hypothetical protein
MSIKKTYEVEVKGTSLHLPIENLITSITRITKDEFNKGHDDETDPSVIIMKAENNNQNENLVTQLFYNDNILEAGLSIKQSKGEGGHYYVSTSLYNKNKAAYDNYKCLLIENNGITYRDLVDLTPEAYFFIDNEYDNIKILKPHYAKNKSKYDLLGVKILIEIERNYILVPNPRYNSRQRQIATALHIMNRPHY